MSTACTAAKPRACLSAGAPCCTIITSSLLCMRARPRDCSTVQQERTGTQEVQRRGSTAAFQYLAHGLEWRADTDRTGAWGQACVGEPDMH